MAVIHKLHAFTSTEARKTIVAHCIYTLDLSQIPEDVQNTDTSQKVPCEVQMSEVCLCYPSTQIETFKDLGPR